MQALPFAVLVGVGLFFAMVLTAVLTGVFRAPCLLYTSDAADE